jgi:hypothetical protein
MSRRSGAERRKTDGMIDHAHDGWLIFRQPAVVVRAGQNGPGVGKSQGMGKLP